MESKPFATYEQRIIFEVTILYIILIIGIMMVVSIVIWDRPTPTIAWVPVDILEWAFIGGMIAVIYRLAYQRKRYTNLVQLGTWVIARPLIGTVMGVLVYFLALGTLQVVTGKPDPVPGGTRLFYLIAFIAAFSDRWYTALIDWFSSKQRPDQGDQAAGTQTREV
jgi:hypothetical protein